MYIVVDFGSIIYGLYFMLTLTSYFLGDGSIVVSELYEQNDVVN